MLTMRNMRYLYVFRQCRNEVTKWHRHAGETVQPVKCLPYKHEVLGLTSRDHLKMPGTRRQRYENIPSSPSSQSSLLEQVKWKSLYQRKTMLFLGWYCRIPSGLHTQALTGVYTPLMLMVLNINEHAPSHAYCIHKNKIKGDS